MMKPRSTMADQISLAASLIERRRTGHARKWLTVFLNADTMVITLHGALTAAEQSLIERQADAGRLEEFHRRLFTDDPASLWRKIRRITGMEVRDATAEVDTTNGTVVQVLTNNTVVKEFLLNLSDLTRHDHRPPRCPSPEKQSRREGQPRHHRLQRLGKRHGDAQGLPHRGRAR